MVCEETRKPYKNNHVNHLITEITTGTVISLRSADVFPVVASLPPKISENLFSKGEKRRPEIRLRFVGYR